ncbi:hypothetical protein P9112_010131 [Eukaryota sp. TZLM1-RC]
MNLPSVKQDYFQLSIHNFVNDDPISQMPSYTFHSSMDGIPLSCTPPNFFSSNSYGDVSADPSPDRSDRLVGIKSISSGDFHTVLLTYSGEVFGWGSNDDGQVLYDGPDEVKSPIETALNDMEAISTAVGSPYVGNHSFALSFDGKLYGWGSNRLNQINRSSKDKLPITKINIPYKIKEVYCGDSCSFALTHEGQVVKWGNSGSFELIKGLNNIVSMSVDRHSFVAVDLNSTFYYFFARYRKPNDLLQIGVTKQISSKAPFQGSFLLVGNYFFVIDVNGDVWKFSKRYNDVSFCDKPTKVPGLANVLFINGCKDVYAAIDNNGKVFVWGQLSRISQFYKDSDEPKCIEAFIKIEGISVGYNFLFAYNKNTVWAWGRNDKGQLGTGDLIDRPQPVKVFGSEILGSFQYPKQPLIRMFSGLIKLVYWEYLSYLDNLYGNHPYIKARFYTKCGISKRVAQFAQEVFNVHPIQNKIFLKDPQDLDLNENICDLHLRLSTDYTGFKIINSRIQKLDVYYNFVDYDPQLFLFFPNVEAIKLKTLLICPKRVDVNLAHLLNLSRLELDSPFNIQQLPTSLVKLELNGGIGVTDLSHLTSLKELVVMSDCLSLRILEGQIPLPQSIARLKVLCQTCNIEVKLPKLQYLVIHKEVPSNITEENFPSLRFVHWIGTDEHGLSGSSLSPTELINQALVQSVKLIKNVFLVELSSFPWWIQYPAERFLFDILYGYLDETDKVYLSVTNSLLK